MIFFLLGRRQRRNDQEGAEGLDLMDLVVILVVWEMIDSEESPGLERLVVQRIPQIRYLTNCYRGSNLQDDDTRKRRPSAALGTLMPSGGGVTGLSGTPANLGKYTPKSSMSLDPPNLTIELADVDPLGVDQNIDFTAVGGLDDCTSPSHYLPDVQI